MEGTHNPTEAALRAALTRRRFLRGSAAGALGVAAATVAACAPAPPAAWLYRSPTPGASGVPPTGVAHLGQRTLSALIVQA